MPESLETLCLFLRDSSSYYEKIEETYEEWFRNELGCLIEDFAVISEQQTLKDIKRIVDGLEDWTKEGYQKLDVLTTQIPMRSGTLWGR